MTEPFPLIEQAVKAVIEAKYPPAVDRVGGDLSYDGTDFYVWIGLVPGAGSTDQLEGSWAVDIDVFATQYGDAMHRSLAIEAALLGGRHVAAFGEDQTMIIDRVYQNAAPSDRPWDDESVFRVGATYVFTARRSG